MSFERKAFRILDLNLPEGAVGRILLLNIVVLFLLCCKIEAVYVDPSLKHAIRYSDDGLFAATINAYADEWNNTMITGLDPNLPGLMKTSSPLNFWFRCIDREIRGYFYIESMFHNPTPYYNIMAYGPGDMMARLKLFADGNPVSYGVGHGGGDFFVNVSSKPPHSEVVFSVGGWTRFTSFPLSLCVQSRPQPAEPVYMIHAHTYDHPPSVLQSPLLPSGVAHHLIYHRCALNVTKYEVVIQPEDLHFYLKNPHLLQFAQRGWLTFILKSRHPSRLALPYMNCHYQVIYENQGILQHWKENVRIFYFNPDEYMSMTTALTWPQFRETYLLGSNVAFDRYMTFCYDCPKANEPELPHLSFTDRRYKITEKLNDPKILVDPNRSGCMVVHFSNCGVDRTLLSNETAYLIHFENLYNKRWTNDSQDPYFNKVYYHAFPDLDKRRMPLLQCDPQKIFDFKSGRHIKKRHFRAKSEKN